jgi:hypothetical protein
MSRPAEDPEHFSVNIKVKYRIISFFIPEVGGTCGTNGRGEERVYVIGRKTGGKETTRKTET